MSLCGGFGCACLKPVLGVHRGVDGGDVLVSWQLGGVQDPCGLLECGGGDSGGGALHIGAAGCGGGAADCVDGLGGGGVLENAGLDGGTMGELLPCLGGGGNDVLGGIRGNEPRDGGCEGACGGGGGGRECCCDGSFGAHCCCDCDNDEIVEFCESVDENGDGDVEVVGVSGAAVVSSLIFSSVSSDAAIALTTLGLLSFSIFSRSCCAWISSASASSAT